jgi:acetyl-CoA acyltransferase 1
MGWTSEMVAQTYNISRQKQDEYALISHTRALEASKAGRFAHEIIPVEIRGTVMTSDDPIRPTSAEGLAALKPVFPDWGIAATTAGNASGIGDGAALCVLATRARAEQEGLPVIAKYVGTAIVGVEPRYMGISPVVAVPKILDAYGLAKEDIDIYEVRSNYDLRFGVH